MSKGTITLATPTGEFVDNIRQAGELKKTKFSDTEIHTISSVLYFLLHHQEYQATMLELEAFIDTALTIYDKLGVKNLCHVAIQEQFKRRFC